MLRAIVRRRARLSLESLEQRMVLDSGNPWTLVMMPDTQYLSESQDLTDRYFIPQTEWVRDHVASNNIKFLSHVGDVVQNNVTAQWQRADAAMDRLDGAVPYSVVLGNHDYDSVNNHASANAFKSYFGSSRYAGRSWYGGSSSDQLNHYQVFQAEGRTYLHIGMEWHPRASSVAWVQSVIDAHPTLPTILTTHAYVDTGGHSSETSGSAYLSGQQIYQQIVRPNPQVFLTLNGHFGGERNQISVNDENLPVIEMLANYQSNPEGGRGYMRLMRFVPQSDRIEVKSYSPGLNAYYTDANSQFNVPLDFDRRLVFTPLATFVGDNAAGDGNPADNAVSLSGPPAAFDIRLSDIDGGIRDTSVTAATVSLVKNGVTQSASTYYTYSYNASTDTIRLASRTGSFDAGAYQIRLSNGTAKIADAKNLPMVAQTIAVQVGGTGGSTTQTVTFQEGAGGYTGATDTYVRQGAPSTSHAGSSTLDVDNDDGGGTDNQALLNFRNIFGSSMGQIPPGAQIGSARLELQVTNPGSPMAVHRMLKSWTSGATWNSLSGGVSADGVEAAAARETTTAAVPVGQLRIDVTPSLRAWHANPSQALGWALLPTGSDGVTFHSGQGATPPRLVVEYTVASASSAIAAAPAPNPYVQEVEDEPSGSPQAAAAQTAAATPTDEAVEEEAPAEETSPDTPTAKSERPARRQAAPTDQALEELFADK